MHPIPEQWRNQHAGERCFVLGNGPSLLDQDLTLVRQSHTIGCNRIGTILSPDFLCCSDLGRYEKYKDEIDAMKCPTFFIDDLLAIIPSDSYVVPINRNGDLSEVRELDDALQQIHPAHSTVTNLCLPLANFLGFSHVYLLGCDCTETGHCDQREPEDDIVTQIPLLQENLRIMASLFAERGKLLANATPNDNIPGVPWVRFERLWR